MKSEPPNTSKIRLVCPAEPKSSDHMVQMAQGLLDILFREDVDYLTIQYRIEGEVYSYSFAKK